MRAELFHDDGSRQWRSAEAVIRDTSRTRRDFFLVQRIDLPANLSVGKYNLKVTVRDRLAGEGGAEAELAVPIQIVADAGLLGGGDPVTPPAAKPVSSAPVAGPNRSVPRPRHRWWPSRGASICQSGIHAKGMSAKPPSPLCSETGRARCGVAWPRLSPKSGEVPGSADRHAKCYRCTCVKSRGRRGRYPRIWVFDDLPVGDGGHGAR